MKRIQCLLVAIFAVVIFSGDAAAQQPSNQAKFGRGRLLRKWRDDLTGKTQKPKRPTPAQQGKQPTPAQMPSAGKAAQIQRNGKQQTVGNVATRQSSTGQTPSRQSQSRQSLARSTKRIGFGMQVEVDKEDNFVVTQVDKNGNADEAGIRRGDLITQLGGADIGSLEEFKEIVKVLGEGDQMELQISRNGKKKEVTVQYGEMQEIPATIADDNPATPAIAATPVTGPYDFVPQKNNQFRSVLDGPVVNRRGQRVPTRPASSGATLNGPGR